MNDETTDSRPFRMMPAGHSAWADANGDAASTAEHNAAEEIRRADDAALARAESSAIREPLNDEPPEPPEWYPGDDDDDEPEPRRP